MILVDAYDCACEAGYDMANREPLKNVVIDLDAYRVMFVGDVCDKHYITIDSMTRLVNIQAPDETRSAAFSRFILSFCSTPSYISLGTHSACIARHRVTRRKKE